MADPHITSLPRIRNKDERFLQKVSQVTYRRSYEIDHVKAQDMGLKFYQTFSCAVVHIGDIPAECIARVVSNDLV